MPSHEKYRNVYLEVYLFAQCHHWQKYVCLPTLESDARKFCDMRRSTAASIDLAKSEAIAYNKDNITAPKYAR